MKKQLEKIENTFKEYRFLRKPFLILCLLYVLGISGILRANFYFRDDLGRAMEGYHDFADYCRYISQWLSTVVHTDSYLADIAPLAQILAAVILAGASVLAICVLTDHEKKVTLIQCIAVLPLGLSPCFLECFSYRFDSPYMALSVLFSILPLLIRRKKSYPVWTAVCILAVCCSYQASTGIFPALVILTAFLDWNKNEPVSKVLKYVGISAAGYAAGLGAFRLVLFTGSDSYLGIGMPKIRQLPAAVLNNLYSYFRQVYRDWNTVWIVLAAAVCAAFVVMCMLKSGKNKAAAFFLSGISLAAAFCVSYGIYTFLAEAPLMVRCLYGFGAVLAFASVVGVSGLRRYPVKMISIALSWCFLAFAFIYGNALNAQKEYTDFRAAMIISDLNRQSFALTDDIKRVQFTGSVEYAPAVKKTVDHFPILKRMVTIPLKEGAERWNSFLFFRYYNMKNIWCIQDGDDFTEMNLPVIADTMYHTIRSDGEHILIELK